MLFDIFKKEREKERNKKRKQEILKKERKKSLLDSISVKKKCKNRFSFVSRSNGSDFDFRKPKTSTGIAAADLRRSHERGQLSILNISQLIKNISF